MHARWHARPAPHSASQGTSGAQRPVERSQKLPASQITPEHVTGRQPAIQRPSMQVSPSLQLTSPHGSTVATQSASQRASPVQRSVAVAHGSSWQTRPRQTWPNAQSRSSVHGMTIGPPSTTGTPPSPPSIPPRSGVPPASGVSPATSSPEQLQPVSETRASKISEAVKREMDIVWSLSDRWSVGG